MFRLGSEVYRSYRSNRREPAKRVLLFRSWACCEYLSVRAERTSLWEGFLRYPDSLRLRAPSKKFDRHVPMIGVSAKPLLQAGLAPGDQDAAADPILGTRLAGFQRTSR